MYKFAKPFEHYKNGDLVGSEEIKELLNQDAVLENIYKHSVTITKDGVKRHLGFCPF